MLAERKLRTTLALLLIGALAGSLLAVAQTAASSDPDLDSQIQSVRADARADKVAIITEAMKFTPQESAAFWPIYKKYEFDLSKINDQRVELIKSYSDKFVTMTDADAKELADKSFDLESQRTDLKKRYFKEFNKQLPATTVAKFFQLEHRLDLLVDLKIASELPALLVKSSTAASTSTNP